MTLGTPGDDITVTGPVVTRVLNWGFSHFWSDVRARPSPQPFRTGA